MKRLNPITLLLAGLAAAALMAAACGTAPTAAPPGGTPLPVVVDNFAVIAEGRVLPRQFVQLSFTGGGRVAEVLAAEGSPVAAEAVIARLDLVGADTLAAQIAGAELELLNAQQAVRSLSDSAPITTAQAAFNVTQAREALTKAEKDLRLVENPAGKGLTDSVADTKLALETAQANLLLANVSPEQQALYAATAAVDQAFRIYQDLQARLDENTGSLELQDAVRQAQAAYQAALDQQSTLRLTIDTAKANQSAVVTDAQERYDTAVRNLAAAERGPDAAKLSMAQAKLGLAQATLLDAQAQFAKVQAGPDPAQMAQAQARLAAAQASLDATRKAATDATDHAELRAPFGGTLAALDLKEGEQAVPGQPVGTLADLSGWRLETDNLTEIEVVKIQPGQGVSIVLDALPGVVLRGKVETISSLFEEKRGDVTYTVRIVLTDNNPLIRWGMTAKVTFDK